VYLIGHENIKSVIIIPRLSPIHFVSNICHQHRCSPDHDLVNHPIKVLFRKLYCTEICTDIRTSRKKLRKTDEAVKAQKSEFHGPVGSCYRYKHVNRTVRRLGFLKRAESSADIDFIFGVYNLFKRKINPNYS